MRQSSDRPADMPSSDTKQPSPWGRAAKAGAKLALILAVVGMIAFALPALEAQVLQASPATQMMMTLGLLVSYALLIAIPFVPGIEIGIGILVLKGADAAPSVYAATVIGLSIAFCFGRLVPIRWIEHFAHDLGARRLARRLAEFDAMPFDDKMAGLASKLPNSLAWLGGRFRYVLLALLINLPGSSAIGGGGGILMFAGLSRLFRIPYAIATIALAVLPVPLVVWFLGGDALGQYFGA